MTVSNLRELARWLAGVEGDNHTDADTDMSDSGFSSRILGIFKKAFDMEDTKFSRKSDIFSIDSLERNESESGAGG
jgi:hypothetical protein